VYTLLILNSGVTELKFTKFLHDVARSSQMNLLNQNGDIAMRFGMQRLRIKVNSPILPIPDIE